MTVSPPSYKLPCLPDGPEDTSSLQTLRLLGDAGSYLLEMRHKFGSVFTLRPLRSPLLVVVSDLELVHTLFTGDPTLLHAGDAKRILEPASGPQSVLFLDEEAYLSRRRLLLSGLQDPQLKSYAQIITDAVDCELDAWPLNDVIKLYPRFRDMALDVMLRVVLEKDELNTWPKLKPYLLSLQIPASRDQARAMLGEVVSHVRHREYEGSHMLAILLGARDHTGRPLSDDAILDELLALLVVGDSTAGTLAWAAERLCRNVAVQERLRSAIFNESDERYIDAVINEILRTRPVLPWSMRQLTRDLHLGDWLLPEGTIVAVSIYLIHHDPDLYPEPERFLPNRFLANRQPSPYTFIPFGGGIRRCLGARLAMLEVRIVMSNLLRRFELQLPDGSEADESWRRSGITYVPADGALVRLLPVGC